MAVRAVEMVRKIRDKHGEESKDLSIGAQIKFVKDKARKLQGTLMKKDRSKVGDRPRTTR